MEAIESLVTEIQGLSGSNSDVTHLHNKLKKAEDSLRSHSTRLSPLLYQLDPAKHSLGYLYFLEALLSSSKSKEHNNELVLTIATFLSSCDAHQIRMASDKFVTICKKFKSKVIELEAPMRGVAPLLTAIRKLQPSSEHMTALHPDFLLLCLLAKCYRTGVSILNDDVSEVDKPTDFFLCCYYGGMICIGQKSFGKALELLHNVVTAPMHTLNAIAVEAFQKHIMVSLIHHGQVYALPKYTSSLVQRNIKGFSGLYMELANNYKKGSIAVVERFVEEHRAKFDMDNNFGLAKQVVSSMYKRNIQRLTQTYLTLSLQDIADTVQLNSPKEAEMHVLQMIQDGDIHATINQKDGMVRFLEDPEQYKSCQMIEHIDSSIQRMVTLSKKLTSMDELMSCDPLYLSKAGRERPRFDYDDFDPIPPRFNM